MRAHGQCSCNNNNGGILMWSSGVRMRVGLPLAHTSMTIDVRHKHGALGCAFCDTAPFSMSMQDTSMAIVDVSTVDVAAVIYKHQDDHNVDTCARE